MWGGFARGQRVYVRRSDIKVRGAKWTFLCHAVNTRTGSEWLEVFGGAAHHQTMRAFKPTDVRPHK